MTARFSKHFLRLHWCFLRTLYSNCSVFSSTGKESHAESVRSCLRSEQQRRKITLRFVSWRNYAHQEIFVSSPYRRHSDSRHSARIGLTIVCQGFNSSPQNLAPSSPSGPSPRPMHERFATFPAGDFKSVFVLENLRPDASIQVTAGLILSAGEIPMDSVTIPPHSTATMDINAFLQAHGYSDTQGTAFMRYTYTPYDPITGGNTSTSSIGLCIIPRARCAPNSCCWARSPRKTISRRASPFALPPRFVTSTPFLSPTPDLVSVSNQMILVNFVIASNATPGNRSVTVTTAGGTSNSVNFLVQIPTSLQMVPPPVPASPVSSCTFTLNGKQVQGAGCQRNVTWQIMDQRSPTPSPIQASGLAPSDSPANAGGTNTCGFPASGGKTGTGSTNNDGQFPDTYSICSTACLNGGSCQSTELQTWTVNGFVLSSDVKTVVFTCRTITVNGN